jgi:hypothetical protein
VAEGGVSRVAQLTIALTCLIIACNFVHVVGWFNQSTHGELTGDSIRVKMIDETENAGDIVNAVAFGSGGGLWGVINFILNFPFPSLMLYDMGMNPIIAVVINAGWVVIAPIGIVEIITGRQILQ